MITPDRMSRKQLKELRLLQKRSGRHGQGLFIVEGLRAVRQVIDNRVLQPVSLILDEGVIEAELKARNSDASSSDGFDGSAGEERATMGAIIAEKTRDFPLYAVSSTVFRQLSDTDSAQGVMAVCRIPGQASSGNLVGGKGTLLVLDRIQDPGNLGTMIRTAVWFGLMGIVVSPGTVDLFHPKVVRSTAGATGVLPWLETELPDFLSLASENRWRIHLLDAGPGSKSWRELSLSDRQIIVVGNEANGIATEVREQGHDLVRIDGVPGSNSGQLEGRAGNAANNVESLNASVAAAIVIAHLSKK